MAPEYLSGSTLSYVTSAPFALIATRTISATLPVSKIEYTSSLSISKKMILYFLELKLVEDPAGGHKRALTPERFSSAISSSSPFFFFCFDPISVSLYSSQ
jgi:hypothetical protein